MFSGVSQADFVEVDKGRHQWRLRKAPQSYCRQKLNVVRATLLIWKDVICQFFPVVSIHECVHYIRVIGAMNSFKPLCK